MSRKTKIKQKNKISPLTKKKASLVKRRLNGKLA